LRFRRWKIDPDAVERSRLVEANARLAREKASLEAELFALVGERDPWVKRLCADNFLLLRQELTVRGFLLERAEAPGVVLLTPGAFRATHPDGRSVSAQAPDVLIDRVNDLVLRGRRRAPA
jgi:hypothetical protein